MGEHTIEQIHELDLLLSRVMSSPSRHRAIAQLISDFFRIFTRRRATSRDNFSSSAESFSCATCHHFAAGESGIDKHCLLCHAQNKKLEEASCSSCHAGNEVNAVSISNSSATGREYHLEKTGLKRAYHLKCLGCHKEMDVVGGCEGCHPKNTSADKEIGQSTGRQVARITKN